MHSPTRLKHGARFWIESRYPRNSKWLRRQLTTRQTRQFSRARSRQHPATARFFKSATARKAALSLRSIESTLSTFALNLRSRVRLTSAETKRFKEDWTTR